MAATSALERLLTVHGQQRDYLARATDKNVADLRYGSSQAAGIGTSLPYRWYSATRKFRFS